MAEKNFVKVTKDGMHLVVHPTTVTAHQKRGWVVVAEIEVNENPELSEMNVNQLKSVAKDLGFEGYSNMKKEELLDLLQGEANK